MCQLAERDAQSAEIVPHSSHTSLRAGHFGIGDEEHVVSMPHLHSYLSTLEEEFRIPVWQGTQNCLSMLSLRELADKAFPASDLEMSDVCRAFPSVPRTLPPPSGAATNSTLDAAARGMLRMQTGCMTSLSG